MKALNGIVCLTLLTPTFGPVYAGTIGYNNLDQDDAYENYGNWFGRRGPQFGVLAGSFVPDYSGVMDEIWLGVYKVEGANELTVKLYEDDNGSIGKVALWSNTYTGRLGDQFGSVFHVDGLNAYPIVKNRKYWLVTEAPDDGVTRHNWQRNRTGDLSSYALDYSGSWQYFEDRPNFAMKIGVTAAPAPASAILFVSGIIGMSLVARARKPLT